MKLSQLIVDAGVSPLAVSGDADVTSISADSRVCDAGSLFVCMPSKSSDTHRFIAEAAQRGAKAFVVHSSDGLQAAVEFGAGVLLSNEHQDFNKGIGAFARILFNDPSSAMRVIGITGTNGKTTTAWMMRDALRAMGRRASYLGTLGFDPTGARRELSNTTPFPIETWTLLDEARRAGVQDFVMEASSHALFERRLSGVRFEVGVFTNLSQDHLDFHGDMESYAEAKWLLFDEYAERADAAFRSAINVGDPIGRKFAERRRPTVSFGDPTADLVVEPREKSASHLVLNARYLGAEQSLRVGVGGLFNVWNATSTLAALLAAGHKLEEASDAMSKVTPVPGRFESVPNDKGFSVIVDYAHTEDALEKLLASARELGPKRIITVFGCGGDRDRTKRPRMARAASTYSEVTIVTSDNPRTEDPQEIIKEVVSGLVPGSECLTVIDRREAIARAMKLAQVGDIVVIAGKGHEDYQIIGRTKHPMDDRVMAKEALECV